MTTTVQTPETLIDGPFGARLLIEAGDFSLVEHPIAPRTLAGPSHVHQHEDEYSYVLEGEVGFEIGDEVLTRRRRPARRQAARHLARLLERRRRAGARARGHLPGGFERYFAELAQLIPPAVPSATSRASRELQARYGLEMDFGSIERLSREHGLGSP